MAREISSTTPHKGCNSSSCCSPAKLWRNIQALIKDNDKKGLIQFFKDPRQEHIVRAALTSRISNDAAMFPPSQQHKLIRIEERKLEANKYLGKACNDLNSLQLALITSSEGMVLTLLNQLKLHATRQELNVFLSHVWGQGNTCLHLAVFLKRHLVVKALMELGCKPDHLNARKKSALDCCYYGDQRMMDLLSLHSTADETTAHLSASKVAKPTVPMTQIDMSPSIDKTEEPIPVVEHIEKLEPNIEQLPIEMPLQVEDKTKNDQQNYLLLVKMILKQQRAIHAENIKVDLPLSQNFKRLLQSYTCTQHAVLTQLKKPPDILQHVLCC